MTAQGFNEGFPHVATPQPGDLVTFDTGRDVTGGAGNGARHIGAVSDVVNHLMMHTDGAGPARISDYLNRDGGPLSYVDVLGGTWETTGAGAGGSVGGWGTTAGMNTVDPIQNFGAMNMARGTAAQVGPIPAGGAVERWRPMYADAIAYLGSSVKLDNMLYQMKGESGGDPLAYNGSDSNFRAGKPSKSLLQTIPSTFRANAAPGFGTNIWDPWSNALSSLNCVASRYGSVYPGGAYDTGGWLRPGGAGINLFNKPEAVLTPAQSDAYVSHAQALQDGFSGKVPNITVNNYIDGEQFDSRTEVIVDGALNDVTAQVKRGAMST